MISAGYGDLRDNGDISRLLSLVPSGMHKMMWYNALSQKPTIWHADGTRQSPPKNRVHQRLLQLSHHDIWSNPNTVTIPYFSHNSPSIFPFAILRLPQGNSTEPRGETAVGGGSSRFVVGSCWFYSSSIHWKGYGWYLRGTRKEMDKKIISNFP